MSAISDIQSQYSKLEAWLYDSIIAPGSVDVKLNVLRPWLKSLPKSAAVLDVGCGGGQVIAAVLNEYPNLQMVGIDNSPRQVQRAQAALKKISSQVKIYEDSVSQLHCPDQCFDFVYSIASIKHWPDRHRGLQECLRVLRTGGVVLVTEIDRDCSEGRLKDFVDRWKIPSIFKGKAAQLYSEKILQHSLSLSEVRKYFEEVGVEEIQSGEIPDSPAFYVLGRRL